MEQEQSFTRYFHRQRSQDLTKRGYKRTKIIATIGPACDNEATLKDMYHSGMNIARFNMSHGSHADHTKRFNLVRRLSDELSRPIAVLADLQGPKIRLGKLVDNEPVEWIKGKKTIITVATEVGGTAELVGCTYKGLINDVRTGDTLLVDDGKMRLTVEYVDGDEVHCIIEVGGKLKNNKGLNLPDVQVTAPSLTKKDKEDLAWAIAADVDYIALSFVRSATDIRSLKRRISDAGSRIPVIAKIERPEAVNDIDDILAEADGIMVARGDLGIEISTERLPVVQKHLIARANAFGKTVITATQMLESMIDSPVPTRAESSDVANAVFDGTDVVMLSGETAAGSYPVEAVREMTRIACEAESSPYLMNHFQSGLDEHVDSTSFAITGAANHLAQSLETKGVMVFSHGPEKGLLLSKLRNREVVVCCCYDKKTWRRMSMYWGTTPLLIDFEEDPHDMLEAGLAETLRNQIYVEGDIIVVLSGFGIDNGNSIRLVQV